MSSAFQRADGGPGVSPNTENSGSTSCWDPQGDHKAPDWPWRRIGGKKVRWSKPNELFINKNVTPFNQNPIMEMDTSSGSSSSRSFWALLKEELRWLFPTWMKQDSHHNVHQSCSLWTADRCWTLAGLICIAANCEEPGTEAVCGVSGV